jgi:DNA-binding MarR family transcriptional regulator
MQSELSALEQVILAIRRITRAVDIHSNHLQRKFGLTGPQLTALRVVNRLQPVSAGVLAETANIGQATLSGILLRLELSGLVTRTRDPANLRTVILTTTAAGQRLLETAPSLLPDRFRKELRRMPASERGLLLAAIVQVASLMEADTAGEFEDGTERSDARSSGS